MYDEPIREQEKDKYSREVDSDGVRWYSIGDKEFPSVTSIIGKDPVKKKQIDDWRKRHRENPDKGDPEDYTYLWQKTGDAMHHKILSRYTSNEIKINAPDLSEVPPDVLANVIRFKDKAVEMWDLMNPTVYGSPRVENVVWDTEYGYAGSADFIGELEIPGKLERSLVLMDLKSTPWIKLKNDLDMQLAAYREALKSFNIPTPNKAIGIGLCGDPSRNSSLQNKVKILNEDELDEGFERFLELKRKVDM